jgi:hypothetical protein
MRQRRRPIRTPLAALLALAGVAALLAACGGGGDDTDASSTTRAEPTTTTSAPPLAPLTGLPSTDADTLARPALVVKIDNVEPKSRPQAGLNAADIVFEERVEGSVTRLLAIFDSTNTSPVGPVRSARTSDLGVLNALRVPYFAWSGANDFFKKRIREAPITDVGYDAASEHYQRVKDRKAPDNLMLKSTAELRALPADDGAAPPPPFFTYRAAGQAPAHLEPVTSVHISYGTSGGAAPVDYAWNGTGWARSQKGTPHVDADGLQVAPANLIVQFVQYASSGVPDQFGVMIPEAQLVGSGDCWVFTAGGMVQGHWSKPTLQDVTTYTDASGNPIGLTPGRTWVALPTPGNATHP